MLPLLISLCCREMLCYWIWRLPDFLLKLEESWQGITLKSLELLICTYLHRFACVLHVATYFYAGFRFPQISCLFLKG